MGSCGSLQESTSRVWGLRGTLDTLRVFFVLAGTHSFRVNTFLIEIMFVIFFFFPLVKDHHSSKFRSWLKGCSKGHRSGSATHFAEAEL